MPESFNTLSLAAVVVLILNPTSLFDTGAQLSFIAVAVLIWTSQWLRDRASSDDPLDRLIARTRPRPVRIAKRLVRTVGELFLMSALVWAVTLPLVAHRFHLISFVGPLINPVVCLPVAVALFSGLGVFVMGGFSPPLGAVFGWLCDTSLHLLEECLAGALYLPWAYCWIPHVPEWWVTGYYAALGVGIARLSRPAAEEVDRLSCSVADDRLGARLSHAAAELHTGGRGRMHLCRGRTRHQCSRGTAGRQADTLRRRTPRDALLRRQGDFRRALVAWHLAARCGCLVPPRY